jgi:hypothetical protein
MTILIRQLIEELLSYNSSIFVDLNDEEEVQDMSDENQHSTKSSSMMTFYTLEEARQSLGKIQSVRYLEDVVCTYLVHIFHF